MEQHSWILVPWAVFAFGMGLKIWQIYLGLRRALAPAAGVEAFRRSLERIWARDQQAA